MAANWFYLFALIAGLLLAYAFYQLHWLRRRLAAAGEHVAELTHDLQAEAVRTAFYQGQLEAIGDAISDALFVVDESRCVISLNEVAANLFPIEHPIGRPFIEVIRDHEIHQLLGETLAGHVGLVRQIYLDDRVFLVRAVRFRSDGSKGAVITLRDITELTRLSRARRDFVANISHDLRTPLTTIRLLVETLQRGAAGDKKLWSQLVERISAEVDMLERLAQELLDLSQLESGKVLLKLTPVSLAQVVDEVIDHLASLAERKGITVSSKVTPSSLALADGEKLSQVLTNLIHNAIKFTPNGGRVVVDAQANDEWLQVSVEDTGIGIPAQELPRIFERFYTVDRARRRADSGMGLGLAIAKHIVEAHGGRIWAQSDEGRGSTFYFTVPRAEPSSSPESGA
ncbi:MAG: PAS domain-containing protein [Chloroflexi bacterium]|nr:PAS domain-containing protein [Chloroflexota bacterium]